jgi:hypothetical protein
MFFYIYFLAFIFVPKNRILSGGMGVGDEDYHRL